MHSETNIIAGLANNYELVLCGRNRDMIVSVALNGEYGIDGVALQVSCYVSSYGASVIASTTMTKEELDALAASAEVIRSNS